MCVSNVSLPQGLLSGTMSSHYPCLNIKLLDILTLSHMIWKKCIVTVTRNCHCLEIVSIKIIKNKNSNKNCDKNCSEEVNKVQGELRYKGELPESAVPGFSDSFQHPLCVHVKLALTCVRLRH